MLVAGVVDSSFSDSSIVDCGGGDPGEVGDPASIYGFESGELADPLTGEPVEVAQTPAGVFDGGGFTIWGVEQESTVVSLDAPSAGRARASIMDHMMVKRAHKDQVV